MQLEAEASSVKGGELSDMEREQYQNQIKDLLQAVETLLKSNKAMGERVTQLEKVAEAYDDLKAKYAKLEGEPLIFYETTETPANAGAKACG